MKTNYVLVGDVLDKLNDLPEESIQCCVTSPPYWGLRDYGESDQLGLEKTPEEFTDNLVKVFREVKRVLRKDGTCWLNIGDSYAGNMSRASNNGRAGFGNQRETVVNRIPVGLKQKDLVGIPWRVALALQQDGWYLRQDIIWHKPNPMPESVKDRCTKSHEYIFLLTKSSKYYYDIDAIREPLAESSIGRLEQDIDNQIGTERANGGAKTNGNLKAVGDVDLGRNKRSVWTITTKPFSEAHFAVFPPELPTLCIKAGSKEGDIILDPFMGSGTTAWVAQRLSRKWIGVELNHEYVKIINKRVSQQELF